MGNSAAKQTSDPSAPASLKGAAPSPSGKTPATATTAATPEKTPLVMYKEFRDDLLAFSLGEAAHDYAGRLLKEQPKNPALMALYGETSWMYEKVKNPTRREHWCDRLDILQGGVDTVRKCIKENPDYAPCHRVYALLAVKMSDQEYWFKLAQPFGVMEHYKRIINRGTRAVQLEESADVYQAMAQVSARCATNMKKWYTPYSWYAKYKGLPTRAQLLEQARDYHISVNRLDPESVENACRLGMVYWEMGDVKNARKWYTVARDVLKPREKTDDMYQTMAHTHLVTQLNKHTWNVPFG